VIGKDLTNPIPEWAEHGADRKVVPYTVATDMDSSCSSPVGKLTPTALYVHRSALPHLVGAEYCVTSCDLGIFVDHAAQPVPPQNPDT
jgi:hypothetical protein